MLIDLEPRVVDRIRDGEYRDLFNPENFFGGGDGGGAGNNWASGFRQGEEVREGQEERGWRRRKGRVACPVMEIYHIS